MPFYLAATTGAAGFALQNATPTIVSWTAPNDGQLHSVNLSVKLNVGSGMTGGTAGVQVTELGSASADTSITVFNAKASTGWFHFPDNPAPDVWLIGPGATIAVVQLAALTAGAATLYANIYVADYFTPNA